MRRVGCLIITPDADANTRWGACNDQTRNRACPDTVAVLFSPSLAGTHRPASIHILGQPPRNTRNAAFLN